jgi:hypothetical protein
MIAVDNANAAPDSEERIVPVAWHRALEHPDVKRPFAEVLREHMVRVGISDLEGLWERFQESGERLQRWRFMRMCEGAYHLGWDARFVRGIVFALGYDPKSEEAGIIGLSYSDVWRYAAGD